MEKFDEILLERTFAVDGQSKFKVNGKGKKSSEIKEMFKQIRLNVDNFSTFFVRQGKVSEIVKFQPIELMSFIEESAGVSLYNQVRNTTVNSMEKNVPKMKLQEEQIEHIRQQKELKSDEYQTFRKYDELREELKCISSELRQLVCRQEKQEKIQLTGDIEELERKIRQYRKEMEQILLRMNELVLQRNKTQFSEEEKSLKFKKEQQHLATQNLNKKQQILSNLIEEKQSLQKKLDEKQFKEKTNQRELQRNKNRLEELKTLIRENETDLEKLSLELHEFKSQQQSVSVEFVNDKI